MFYALALLPAVAGWMVLDESVPVIDANRVDEINRGNFGWKASTEQGARFKHMSVKEFKGLLGARLEGAPKTEITTHVIGDIPESFDSRTNWPDCPSISYIRDQSACGSCWAFGAVESISDRYCTYLGKQDPKYKAMNISADDLNSCCHQCGNGCNGGFPAMAWEYWVNHGLTTSDCDPYPFPECEHHIPQNHYPVCRSEIYPTPACSQNCKSGEAKKFYKGSKTITVQGEQQIQQEIMTNGPVEVAFTVYKDFESYKSGVYRKTSDQMLGGHAVRMLGWGVTSDGTKYWIVANSWNPDWGMNGYFEILRGTNECGIESEGWGGVPATF